MAEFLDRYGNAQVSSALARQTEVKPAATTTAAGDQSVPFGQQVTSVLVQNNSASLITIRFDQAATAGDLVVAANGGYVQRDFPCTTLHIWCGAAGVAINGSSASGIVVLGTV